MRSAYYLINGKNYSFKPLVLGQIKQLIGIEVKGLPGDGEDMFKYLLQEVNTSKILAVILHPEDYGIMEKDIDELENEIDFTLTPTEIESMVTDFFVQCPLLEIQGDIMKIAEMNQKLLRVI